MGKELFEIVGIDKKKQQMLVMLNYQDKNHIVQDGVVTGVRYWNFNLGIRSGAYGTEHFADYIYYLKKTYESDKKMQELSKERKSQMLLKNGGNFVPPFKLSVFSSKSFLSDSRKDFIETIVSRSCNTFEDRWDAMTQYSMVREQVMAEREKSKWTGVHRKTEDNIRNIDEEIRMLSDAEKKTGFLGIKRRYEKLFHPEKIKDREDRKRYLERQKDILLRADAISFDTIFHTEENKKIIKSVEEFYNEIRVNDPRIKSAEELSKKSRQQLEMMYNVTHGRNPEQKTLLTI